MPVERTGLLSLARTHLGQGILVIVATAGYGKTTFLHCLTQEIPRSFWIPLTLAHQDVVHLEDRLSPHLSGDIILLDDVHVLEGAPQALEWLAETIRHRPWGWVLSGRWMPPPLAHVLATLPVHFITEKDLAFTLDEVVTWLQPLGYDRETLAAWHERTNGWPLAIAALARISTHYPAPSYMEMSLESFLDTVVFARLWRELHVPLQRFLALTGVALEFSLPLAAYLWERFAPPEFPPVQHVWQDVVRRRLFLEPGTHPDTWRYHDLFRTFLRRQVPDRYSVARHIVRWYEEQARYPEAIEQALVDELWEDAARLLEDLPAHVILETNRIYTFRRWVLTLPPEVQDAHPSLLIRLGADLCAFDQKTEGLELIQRGIARIETTNNGDLLCRTYQALAWAFLRLWDAENARFYANRLLEVATTDVYRQHALLVLGHAHVRWDILPRARRYYRNALALVSEETPPLLETHIRDSLAASVLTPMGFVRQALAFMDQSHPLLQERPAPYASHLQQRATIHLRLGQWEKARVCLENMEHYARQGEAVDQLFDFWRHWAWAMYDVGTGRWEEAERHLEVQRSFLNKYPHKRACITTLQTWLVRRRGAYQEAYQVAEAVLALPHPSTLSRSILALERDIAATYAYADPPPLHPETLRLIDHRAVMYLLRLRGLLAWRCYRQARVDCARRHLQRLAAMVRRFPELETIVADRDPDLSVQIWRVALLLGVAEDIAVRALGRVARLDVLAELLAEKDPHVRCGAARALAETGREEAMPLLHRALQKERVAHVRECMRQALTTLESLPPPRLEVQFLGVFRVSRGGREIPEDAWPRPAVVRLFQYLVLHRGCPLPRDRILEDLWPGQDPTQARNILRRLLSWLRQVLEPYMHSKGPLRYLSTAWDVYTFDPDDRVQVDVEIFEQEVQSVLAAAADADVPPLPETFVRALEGWAPPVSAAMYEDWWVKRVERWRELYVQGCVYAARAYLVRRAYHQAVTWADRALQEAPWMESAYQVKMRALARDGYRTQALAVYEEARAALQRELGVSPSPQTEWLAERLRRGEDI